MFKEWYSLKICQICVAVVGRQRTTKKRTSLQVFEVYENYKRAAELELNQHENATSWYTAQAEPRQALKSHLQATCVSLSVISKQQTS
jgi:hypothetical protein